MDTGHETVFNYFVESSGILFIRIYLEAISAHTHTHTHIHICLHLLDLAK